MLSEPHTLWNWRSCFWVCKALIALSHCSLWLSMSSSCLHSFKLTFNLWLCESAHTLLWMLLIILASSDNVKLFLKFLPNSILRVGTLRETKATGITIQLDGMTLGPVTIQNNLICSSVPPFVKELLSFKCPVPLLRFPEISVPGALVLSCQH